MSKLKWKLLIKKRGSSTSQGIPPSKENLLWVASTVTLIYGERDAVLVDTFLTEEHSKELLDWVIESGKNLTTIYVTHARGDHYFGLKQLLDKFPNAKPISTSSIVAAIQEQIKPEFIQAFWEPRFPNQLPSQLIAPHALEGNTFYLEGEELKVIELEHTDTAHSTALYISSIGLAISGDCVYNNTHLYLAECDVEACNEWLRALDKIESLHPNSVIAGHGVLDPDNSPRHIGETRQYLRVRRKRKFTNLKIGVFAIVAGLVGAVFFSQSQRPAAMPELNGAVGWLNSGPLTAKSLRGKVVLVNFWTYTCINSLRPMPYVKSWAAKYKDAGLVVIGMHTPEFSFEHERPNVEWATRTFNIGFPVATDSDYNVWQAFHNEAWPAQYIVDGKGEIRYRHYGEGEYVEMERVIQKLLKENGAANVDEDIVSVSGAGAEAAPSNDQRTPETYVGYRQAENFGSPEKVARDSRWTYTAAAPSLDQWGLVGSWNVGPEAAVLQAVPGKVVFRFHARDLNLILTPAKDGKPVRFKITLDGAAPGDNNGVDAGADGNGEIREPRMYQLIRQKGFPIINHTFEIEFLDPGAQVLDFTFG